MAKYTVVAPVAVYLPRKTKKSKRVPISLNWYRNAHHRENNEVKKFYKSLLATQIRKLPIFIKPKITYRWFHASKREADLGNHTAVHQKFFEDALVELGRIGDDNYKYLVHNVQEFGGIDPKNPRVEIILEEFE